MLGLITDRTQQNVYRRKEVASKGWNNMTSEERMEWLGDPLNAIGVNLLPYGPIRSSVVDLKYRNDHILATTSGDGQWLFAISIIGDAVNYENKTFTLSVDSIENLGGGSPEIALYWHTDDNHYDFAGVNLSTGGSVTFDTATMPNTNHRKYLAMYVYVTTGVEVTAGASVQFRGVMLENGDIRHPYVPYTEILPTGITKGAYNYSDLNRVERAVKEISEIVGLGLVTKTDWTIQDIPSTVEMVRYLQNISTIRELIPDVSNIPDVPVTMNNLTFDSANNIEKILLAAYESVTASL